MIGKPTQTRKAAMKILGYRYIIGEWAPTGDHSWHSFRRMDYRDNLIDAQKIIDVLNETDIMFTTYGIILEPVAELI